MEFVLIPAGSFMMESSPDAKESANSKAAFTVTISKPFYLGTCEVTQEQWEAVMGSNPAQFKGRNNPVEQVSWNDVQAFIHKLNQKEGMNRYRLPTEAEWEYAARAGSSTRYFFGDSEDTLDHYAWFWNNNDKNTQPVGQKQPNPLGLYDMYGNVREWVQDWYGSYPMENRTDPTGPSSGSSRVGRGGSWRNDAGDCQSGSRSRNAPESRKDNLGFRLVLSAE
ncbi:formylglycine-generating enzyme family protein [Desulfovibrio sp. OttesenSCG-928-I05]|nr:formylglycine-generating enzyme family protein [Desulfovibrio sp. OttesenSCG-928-I05]